jgi:hypothetical protein
MTGSDRGCTWVLLYASSPLLLIPSPSSPFFPLRELTFSLAQFENLDESVQAEFEQYLEERGVNSALALFIPDLAEWKEQKCVAISS